MTKGLIAILLGALLACGGGGGGSTGNVTLSVSNLAVHLVGGPGDGVQSLILQVQKVEIYGAQGWQTVASPNAAYSLTTLVDGSSALLASGGSLAPGTYTSLRLTLGTGSTAQLLGGNAVPLGLVAPVFLVPVNFTVVSSSSVDLTLIVDPGRSVQPRGTSLVFAPELQVVDRNASGSFTGKIADGAGQPLAGVLVTAQYFPAFGEPAILRRAITKSDGTYALDLLPFGTNCYAVCFPQTGTRVFYPVASAAFTPQNGTAVATFNPPPSAMQIRTDLGSTSGTVTPVTNPAQGDEIQLVFTPILAGTATQIFIIGTSPGIMQGSAERWAFTKLPGGSTYRLQAIRRTWSSDGSFVPVERFSADYGFLANSNFPYDFFF